MLPSVPPWTADIWSSVISKDDATCCCDDVRPVDPSEILRAVAVSVSLFPKIWSAFAFGFRVASHRIESNPFTWASKVSDGCSMAGKIQWETPIPEPWRLVWRRKREMALHPRPWKLGAKKSRQASGPERNAQATEHGPPMGHYATRPRGRPLGSDTGPSSLDGPYPDTPLTKNKNWEAQLSRRRRLMMMSPPLLDKYERAHRFEACWAHKTVQKRTAHLRHRTYSSWNLIMLIPLKKWSC